VTVENWEDQRRCLSVPPGPWDADASKETHLYAELICRGCPVRELCEKQTQANFQAGVEVDGLYAGFMWNSTGRGERGRYSVVDWHRTHRHAPGKDAATDVICGVPQVVPASERVIERQCLGPGCSVIMQLKPIQSTRLTCSTSCATKCRSLADRDRRRLKLERVGT
jgi:hypothetical protein